MNSSRLATRALVNKLIPVALLPGRLKLVTKPNLTGSSWLRKTCGTVEVAALAARFELSPVVTMTAGRCCSSSVASSGRRSKWPSAHRDSMATFWPST